MSNWIQRAALVVAAAALISCGSDDEDTTSSGSPSGGEPGGPGPSTSGGGSSTPFTCTELVDGQVLSSTVGFVPYIARTDDGFIVAWIQNGEVVVGALDDDGQVIRRIQVSAAGGLAEMPTVHPIDGGFIVMWSEENRVIARQLNPSGTIASGLFQVADTTSLEPRPTAQPMGDGVMATWMSQPSSVTAFVKPGVVQENGSANGWFPTLAVDGDQALISWSGNGERGPVQVALVNDMAGAITVPDSSALIKSMVARDGQAFVAWEDVSSAIETVAVARIDLSQRMVMAVSHPSAVGASANWPSIARANDSLGVAYYQFRNGPPDLYLAVVDDDLTPLHEELLLAENAKYPTIVADGDRYAIAYNRVGGPVELSIVSCR